MQESDLSSLLSVRETAQTNTQTNAQAVLDLDLVCVLVCSVPLQRLLMHYGPLVDRLPCRETERHPGFYFGPTCRQRMDQYHSPATRSPSRAHFWAVLMLSNSILQSETHRWGFLMKFLTEPHRNNKAESIAKLTTEKKNADGKLCHRGLTTRTHTPACTLAV